jgi:carboxyl-terminal processing protease
MTRPRGHWLSLALLLAIWVLTADTARGIIQVDPSAPTTAALLKQAEQAERAGDWSLAADCYRTVLARERNRADVRSRYQNCLRRSQQIKRHRDASFRQQIKSLSLADSLQLYAEVLGKVQTYFADSDRTDASFLYRQGLVEYRHSLEDSRYAGEWRAAPTEDLPAFRAMFDYWENQSITRLGELPELVRAIAEESAAQTGVPPTAVVLEFICGACAGLDDYSSYLTPAQLKGIHASLRGKTVSAGIEPAVEQGKLVVSRVLPGSSAQGEGIHPRDRLVRIAGVGVDGLSVEKAMELLRGDAHSRVTVIVLSPGSNRDRQVTLQRRLLNLPSISEPRLLDERLGIGYVRIDAFQETTAGELDEAIAQMQMAGLKAIILDLRSNEGGLFEAAVNVAERFISAGVIVSTHGQAGLREYNRYYFSRGDNFLTIPMVVLVDGETASAAELVAGAMKEHQRGTLVGETTFGKGCMQKILKLNNSTAGLRLTVAKFYSPRGHAYTPNGIAPDVRVPRPEGAGDPDRDPQLQSALDMAREMALVR